MAVLIFVMEISVSKKSSYRDRAQVLRGDAFHVKDAIDCWILSWP